MKRTFTAIKDFFRQWGRDESGSATVEAVLWFPAFMVFLFLVIDVSYVFYGESRVMRAIQDGNRAFSVGRLTSTTATESFVNSAISDLTTQATIHTSLTSGIITTTAAVPIGDLTMTGWFTVFSGFNINLRSEHFLEY